MGGRGTVTGWYESRGSILKHLKSTNAVYRGMTKRGDECRERGGRGGIEVEALCLFVAFVSGGKLVCEKLMRELLFKPDGAGRIRNDSDDLSDQIMSRVYDIHYRMLGALLRLRIHSGSSFMTLMSSDHTPTPCFFLILLGIWSNLFHFKSGRVNVPVPELL